MTHIATRQIATRKGDIVLEDIEDRARRAAVAWRSWRVMMVHRLIHDEDGEGVISAAIAVLVMAFLGAAMWVAFKAIFDGASTRVEANVNDIGS